MTFSQPPVDEMPPGDAWQEIESALDDLTRLARTEIRPAELHGQLLQRLVALLSAVGGIVWTRGSDGGFCVECQLNLGESLANDTNELARHRQLAERIAEGGQPRIAPAAYRDAEMANASPWLAILCPVVVENKSIAVVEIFQRSEGQSATVDGYLRLVRTACEIVEEYHKTHALRELHQQQDQVAELVDYVERIHQSLELPATAAAIANEGRRVVGCDRVTVLDCLRRWPRVIAISGVESFDRRSGIVQGLEKLSRSLLAAGEPLWIPEDADDYPPQIVEQVQTLLDESHATGMGLVPVFSQADHEAAPVALLVLEHFAAPFDAGQKKRAALVARASGHALANAITYDRIPLRSVLQRLAAVVGLAPGQRWSPALWVATALIAVILALWLVPADFTVEASGQLMPQHRQHVFAPSDGIVMDLPRRDGEAVRQGELLARMHSPALDIDESELLGKQRTVHEELIAAETATLRTEVEGASLQARSPATARVLQLKEELRGLDAQLEIVRQQQAALAVKSPLNGLVLTWDPERQLAGRPVKRGDTLLTVADTSGPWELVLDVPDHRAGHVFAARKSREPLPVRFQLGTNPGAVGQGTLAEMSPASELSANSQPVVRARVALKEVNTADYRPGAAVIARIHCGRRSLGYVWLHDVWETVRYRLFL